MGRKRMDLTGQRFSSLVVLSQVLVEKGPSKFLCSCDCGNKKVVFGKDLKKGDTKSCGCLLSKRKGNKIEVDGDFVKIWLNGSYGALQFALVDLEDLEKVSKYSWCLHRKHGTSRPQAVVSSNLVDGKRKTILLHRLVMNIKDFSFFVDHQNGDVLDNRKSNLRVCTHQENQCNRRKSNGTSCYKGVSWNERNKNWAARIYVNRKGIYLGSFVDEIQAAKAYDRASLKYHRDFGCTNERLGLL